MDLQLEHKKASLSCESKVDLQPGEKRWPPLQVKGELTTETKRGQALVASLSIDM